MATSKSEPHRPISAHLCVLPILVCAAATVLVEARFLPHGNWPQEVAGPYLGQDPPGLTPKVFAPGIVSTTDFYDVGLAVSPDGGEVYFSRLQPDRAAIFVSIQDGNRWTQPREAEFSQGFFSMEPHITPDGQRLYFFSEGTSSGGERQNGMWFVERTPGGGWSEASFFGTPPVSVATSGNVYTSHPDERGRLVVLPRTDDGLGLPRRLRDASGSRSCWEGHPFIAPDESYILFDARYSPGGQGGIDLWVCFRQQDDSWTDPVNLGEPVNTPGDDWIASVSSDGEYIFYTSNEDIYWVSAGILEGLRAHAER